jgi:hypothetical protein
MSSGVGRSTNQMTLEPTRSALRQLQILAPVVLQLGIPEQVEQPRIHGEDDAQSALCLVLGQPIAPRLLALRERFLDPTLPGSPPACPG